MAVNDAGQHGFCVPDINVQNRWQEGKLTFRSFYFVRNMRTFI